MRTATLALLLAAGTLPTGVAAQQGSALAAERSAYAEWLSSATTSPLAAVAMQRIGKGVTLGPDTTDIPLQGFGPATVSEQKGAVTLTGPDGRNRFLPRGRAVTIAPYTFQVLGQSGTSVLVVYGTAGGAPPGWYAPDPAVRFTVALEAPASRERRRVLTLDGIDVEAELAGHLTVPLGASGTRLQVMRMPIPGTEETELQIYFRDATNDHGTYPAGRFVEVTRTASGQYLVDFNRTRNPFCAYSSVYPCPVPWSGNRIPHAVEAGEKYLPHEPGS